MGFPYSEPDTSPSTVPGVRNPYEAVDESEFGVGRGGGIGYERNRPGHQERLARQGVPPEDEGPYRALSPGKGRRAGKQVRRYDAKRIAP